MTTTAFFSRISFVSVTSESYKTEIMQEMEEEIIKYFNTTGIVHAYCNNYESLC